MNPLLMRARAGYARLATTLLVGLAVLVVSSEARAYSWMLRHGYTACAQCHADPSGGSLLTPYGRAQGEILLRTPYGTRAEDWEPGKTGEFAFGVLPLPEQLLLGGDVRGLVLQSQTSLPDPLPSPPKVSRFILMQADLQAQVTIDRFRANGSVGYAYDGALAASVTRGAAQSARLVSRTHWVGVDLGEDKQVLVRAGRFNLPYGLRHIEHTMWVRSVTRTDINAAQSHGASVAYNGAGLRGELMAIAGNFQLRPDAFRERGYSAYLEYAPYEKLGVGASSLIVHSDTDLKLSTPIWRHAHGLFARFAPIHQVVLLAESDLLVQSQPPAAPNSHRTQIGTASLLQADVEPIQGVHVLVAGEMLDQEPARGPPSYGVWGGAQWFFAPHADVRVDAVYQATPIGGGQSAGTASLLAQFHVYL